MTICRWIELPLIARRGKIRSPTQNELELIEELSERHSIYNGLPIHVFHGKDDSPTDLLVNVVGLPGRQSLLIGSNFLNQEDEFAKATLTLQAARLQNGVYTWKFFAQTIRIQSLFLLLLYFFPSVPPSPETVPSLLLITGTIVISIILDYRSRSLIYDSDRQAAKCCSSDEIENALRKYVKQADVPLSRSRIDEHFELSPSVENRIKKLHSHHINSS